MFATDLSVTEDIHVLLLQSSHELTATTVYKELAQPIHPSYVLQRFTQVAAVTAAVTIALLLLYDLLFGLRVKYPKRTQRKLSDTELALLTGAFAMEWFLTDQFLPSIPDIAAEFQVEEASIGVTLQMHQAASGISTLLVAPLSDRIGRRPVLLAGVLLLVVSTLCAGSAVSYPWFVLGRILQGVSQATATASLALLRDCYEDETERMAKLSVFAVVGLFGPTLAPSLGALLASWMGWRFSFLAIIPLLVVILGGLVLRLEETVPENAGESIFIAAKRTLCNLRRFLMIVAQTVLVAMITVIGARHSVNLEEEYGLPLMQTALVISCFSAPSIFAAILVNWLEWTPRRVYFTMAPLLMLTAIVKIVVGVFFAKSVFCYIGAYLFFSLWPITIVIAISTEFPQEMPDIAGAASAFFNAGPLIMASMVSLPGLALAKSHGASGLMIGGSVYLVLLALGTILLGCTLAGEEPEPAEVKEDPTLCNGVLKSEEPTPNEVLKNIPTQ